MVCEALGVTIFTELKGKFALPRQNAASTLYYIGEGSPATGSNPTLDQVNFVPRTAAVQVNISRKSLFEMSIDAETFVEEDILKVLAIGLDTQVLAATGSGAAPTGILSDSNATVATIAADSGNGGDLAWGDVLGIEQALAQANADRGRIAWVTTPGVRGKLKQTPKIGSTFPVFVWSDDNTVNGYPAFVTNEMPSGLTKGGSSNLHSLIYGNWEDAVLALWGGTEVLPNPYINASAGAIQYNLFQETDTQRRHSNSFVISNAVSIA
jgi:HK97 family phage major capsid protein